MTRPLSKCRAHRHLAREFHAGGLEVEGEHGVAAKPAQAAMEVADAGTEEHAADQAEHGVAEVAMQERHGAGRDAAGEAIAHDEVAAAPQLRQERIEAGEIIAVVGVADDDEPPACRRDAGAERGAIAALRHRDDAGAAGQGIFDRAVGRAVVGDQDLAGDAGTGEVVGRLADTGGDRFGLVEARHQDGEFDVATLRCSPGRPDGVWFHCLGHYPRSGRGNCRDGLFGDVGRNRRCGGFMISMRPTMTSVQPNAQYNVAAADSEGRGPSTP
jgi:hypothetical protein